MAVTEIFIAVPKGDATTNRRHVHWVRMPDICEPGGYIASLSHEAFMHPHADATREDRERCRHTCMDGPEWSYHWRRMPEFITECRITAANPVIKHLDDRLAPFTEHSSIWAFYRHIGFDHKRRRYLRPGENFHPAARAA